MRRTRLAAAVSAARISVGFALIVALGAGCAGRDSTTADAGDDAKAFDIAEADEGNVDYPFRIPAGAGEALDRGEPLEILPATLDVRVGEVIEIVNEDDRGHLVGPFFVGADETLRQEFRSPGTFTGVCTVHPSGEIVVTVT